MTDNKIRCGWCRGDELYEKYHDQEWGVPLFEDRKLFEFLTLETFQAGLSWITILRKRDHFRKAFSEFDYTKVATFQEDRVQQLMTDPGIVRNQAKIRAAISNAQAFMQVQEEHGSFSKYIWAFVSGVPIQNHLSSYREAPSSTALSQKISKDLKSRGFRFVGPTVVYAHMQATGMVNDHEKSCFRYQEIKNL